MLAGTAVAVDSGFLAMAGELISYFDNSIQVDTADISISFKAGLIGPLAVE